MPSRWGCQILLDATIDLDVAVGWRGRRWTAAVARLLEERDHLHDRLLVRSGGLGEEGLLQLLVIQREYQPIFTTGMVDADKLGDRGWRCRDMYLPTDPPTVAENYLLSDLVIVAVCE